MRRKRERRVWSDYGGRGREVRVIRPRPGWRGVWGVKPIRAVFRCLSALYPVAFFVGAGLIGHAVSTDARWLVLVPVGGLFLIPVLRLVRVVPDLFVRSTIVGRVIDRHHQRGSGRTEGPSRPPAFWIAVDDGRSSKVRAHLVGYQVFQRLGEGDEVRLTVSPYCGYVWSAESLDPPGDRVDLLDADPPGA